MNKLIKILSLGDATLLYLLTFFMIGVLHKTDDGKIYGIVFGFWRFQFQLTFGYSSEITNIGETGHA